MVKEQPTEGFTPASSQQLPHLLDAIPHAFLFIDNDGVILHANASAAASIGTAKHELPGNTLWQCAPSLVTPTFYQAVVKAIHTRQPLDVVYRSPITQTWLCVQLSPTGEGLAIFFHETMEPTRHQETFGQNEQMYRDLLESFTDGVAILTPEGLILDINQRPLADAHLQRGEAIGKSYADLPAWSYDPAVQRQLRAAIEQASRGDTVQFEARIRPRTGMYLDVSMIITSHRDANQQVEYLICAGRDITKRKQEETELRTLVDAIPHFVWIMRPDGTAEYENQRWCDYTARTPEQLQGDGWLQCLHPDDRQLVREAWKTAIRTDTLYEVEYRMQNGNTGAYRWFLARGMPLRDAQGTIQRWIGTCTDIDEQKQAEQRLKDGEERLRQSQERANLLMTSSILGIFVAEDEQIVEANETYLHMTGYTREDLHAGKINWVSMTPPEYAIQTQQARQELAVTQRVTRYEKEYVCKDGNRLPVVVGGVTLRLDPLQVIGFVLDNSARKELEQRKDNFISMASHELKTPLAALKLQIQLVRARLARQGFHKMAADLARVEESERRLERLIGALLDVSKMQAGGLEYAQETVDLEALLQEVTAAMQRMNPGYTIVVRGTPLPMLEGDRDRLEQVFTNLISNAIKYSLDAPLVEIDASASEEAVTISVRDHGIGISRDQRAKIFERFYRVADPSQKAIPGLGMGLYIVAEIVKHHGGTITVDSEVGKGSTFRVTLPLKGATG
ncbi:MAG: PAS domain S-box protein [Ktedonobacteraceae bacterium]|nr:PAS domain S-box protein [Ktedonobacteraceae bacterium]